MCVQSVVRERPGEIIAIDGFSSDGTVDVLLQHRIRVISSSASSLGFLRRLGVDAATGKYVMFVDSDVQLGPGCIEKMLNELNRYGWAGIHARLLSAENESYWQRCEDQEFQSHYRFGPTKRIDTIAAMFRKEVLVKCPFDPFFRESAEDVDISRRLVAAHYALGVSSAFAYHFHRRDFAAYVKQRFRNGLGAARIGLKYGESYALVRPLFTAISYVIHDCVNGRVGFIPFRALDGVTTFAGVLVGYSRFRGRTPGLISY